MQLPQARRLLPRVQNARKDIVAKTGLRIQPGVDGPVAARAQVQERAHQGCGANVQGDGEGVGLGIAGLKIQQAARADGGRVPLLACPAVLPALPDKPAVAPMPISLSTAVPRKLA